jgi:hypothetical protein
VANVETLMLKIPSVEQRRIVYQILSRQKAVLASLKIDPDEDIDKLANYWGTMQGVRFNDLRPLMDAIKRTPNGGELRLFYLLPPIARELLYTYRLPPESSENTIMDCLWTTFNFTSGKPETYTQDKSYTEILAKNYYPIESPSIYGDILTLVDQNNHIQHAAIYLAGDLYFTKNGNSYLQPWMIQHLDDIIATYPGQASQLTPKYYRDKVD